MAGEACLTLERIEALAAGDAPGAVESEHLTTCDACRETLEGVKADNALFASAMGAVEVSSSVDRTADAPAGYEFIEEIHRGAQGVVYLAEQIAAKRRVAVKLTLRGAFASMRQRARFDREVELAASLKHPSIVTVYESGGTPSGGRYMAMEYVDGLPLDRWFETRGRAPREVASVIADLADALDAAHLRGVIHRDLKPSNILVTTEGTPKVVDFGIAKGVLGDQEAQTLQGEFVGTLAYAAPEQVTGEPDAVDVRADVYALGALLYEGLTGERPVKLEGSLATSVRAIQQSDPVVPSVSAPDVSADLDAIALRALEKDPRDRYQSARELRDELQRYRSGDAVLARSDDAWYRAKKWARKRRKRIAAAAVAIFALGVTGGLVLAQRAAEAEARLASAQAAVEQAERTKFTDSLEEAMKALDTETSNESVRTLEEFLAILADQFESRIPESPELEANLRTWIGIALTRESDFDDAERQLTRALQRWTDATDSSSPEVAQAKHNLARLYWKSSEYAKAEPLYREALQTRRALGDEHALDAARTAHHLASTLQRLGRFDESVALYEEALAARRELLSPDDPAVANTLNGLGECYGDQRRFDEALVRYQESQRIITAAVGPDDWRTASAAANVGRCLIELGRPDEATSFLQRADEINREWWPADDPRVLRTQLALAWAAGDASRFSTHLEAFIARLGAQHLEVTESRLVHAELLLADREWDAALDAARRAGNALEGQGGEWRIGHAHVIAAEALDGLGRNDESEKERILAGEVFERTLAEDDPLRQRAGVASR